MFKDMDSIINAVLLAAMVLSALWTVMTTRLLRSVVGLALTSAVLTVLMFRLASPLAGVFELSVCAGLIPAIFLSTISLTRKLTPEALVVRMKEQAKRFWYLPVLLVLVGIAASQAPHLSAPVVTGAAPDVRQVLWNVRHVDLLGQIVVLLAGAFGVVMLLKESKRG